LLADGDLRAVESGYEAVAPRCIAAARASRGLYQPQPVTAYEITGARDGATTNATGVFTLESGERLSVELRVSYNPTPVLAGGHWRSEGSTTEEGDVHEESLKFLGGQGSTPSVGGRFRLETYGQPRWRVVMPTRPLKK
jgi:hypothetical protein